MRNIPQFIVPTTSQYEILRFQMIADNGGHHIEHVFQRLVDYLCALNKAMIRLLGVVFETYYYWFFLPQ